MQTAQPSLSRRIAGKISAATLPEGLAQQVEIRAIGSLKLNPKNARTPSDRQIHLLANTIEKLGFRVPVLIDEDGAVLAGHGRIAAARRLGMREVPTLLLSGLSPAQKKAFAIADKRLAELAGWDREQLKIEFEELQALNFDCELTGFSTGEVDVLLDETGQSTSNPADDVLPVLSGAAAVRPGDLWLAGQHRILCADALEGDSYRTLLGPEKADLVFTDPPYNVKVDGHVSGLGKVRHREFEMAAGEMSMAAFTQFLGTVCTRMAAHSRSGSIAFVCMDWRHLYELLTAARPVFGVPVNLCVWAKTNAGMGSLYRSKHELIAVFKNGSGRSVNNVQLGATGRYRTNVWEYAGANTFRKGRKADLEAHPTVKPTALVADAIRDCSHPGDLVLDPFGGSGTTLIAAHRTGRRGRLIELDPVYVETTLVRWQALSGQSATLASTGETLEQVRLRRGAEEDSQ
jgi:DNA modification methylase